MSPREPDLPHDPAEHRPKPLMGWTFWAMLFFAMVCVLAGAAVAFLAPRLLTAPPAPKPAPAPAAAVAPAPATPGTGRGWTGGGR